MNKNILIVDDSIFIKNTLKQIIARYGDFVITEASDGLGAVSQYKKTRPDLVFMDINMPHLNGLEALESIKKFDSEAKVIIMSVKGSQEILKQAVLLGAFDFMVKPLQEGRIIKAITKGLGKYIK